MVREHFETFRAQAANLRDGEGLPRFVEQEFLEFLRCGDCGLDRLVPFSCKARACCPSCGGRRMAERAAHLVDHVFPVVPVRQWVPSSRALREEFIEEVLLKSHEVVVALELTAAVTGHAEVFQAARDTRHMMDASRLRHHAAGTREDPFVSADEVRCVSDLATGIGVIRVAVPAAALAVFDVGERPESVELQLEDPLRVDATPLP